MPGAGLTRRPTSRVRAIRFGYAAAATLLLYKTRGACLSDVAVSDQGSAWRDEFFVGLP